MIRAFRVTAALLLVLSWTALTTAAVIHVPADHAAIQDAIDAAVSGDSILVAPGTYLENLVITGKTLALVATDGRDLTTIRAFNPELDLLHIDATAGLSNLIEGFTLKGVNHKAHVAINLVGAGATVRDSRIAGNREAGLYVNNGGSVWAYGNEFLSNTSAGRASGLLAVGFGVAVIENNLFRDNTGGDFYAVGGAGLHVSSGRSARIVRNVFQNNRTTQIGGGIFASGLDTIIIRNNTLDNNSAPEGAGIFASNAVFAEIVANLITSNFGSPGSGLYVDAVSITSLFQDYNDVWDNVSVNYAGPGNGPGPNSLSLDPIYIFPPDSLTLYPSSPCIDAGDPDPAWNDPDGTRNDIGALPEGVPFPSLGTIRVPEDQATIQSALDIAVPGDTVLVGPGTYNEKLTFTGRTVVLKAAGGPSVTELSGTGLYTPVMKFLNNDSRSTIVEGFTVKNGSLTGSNDGAAIYCERGSPTIQGNWFRFNSAQDGGAIAVISGNPLIVGNSFYRNTASNDGGAIIIYDASADIIGNTFLRNQAGDGGGVYSRFSKTNVAYNLFIHNTAAAQGGAVISVQADLDTIRNNTIYDNVSQGGALTIWQCQNAVALNNICLSNVGSGILQTGSAAFTVDYNDLYGNSLGPYTGLTGGSNDILVDPMVVDSANDDFHLAPGSPCLNSGHPAPEFNDSDGSRNDIGAFPFLLESGTGPYAISINVGSADLLHVSNEQPLISWVYYDPDDLPLVETQLEIGTDSNWTVAETWVPAPIPAPSTEIVHGGLPILPDSIYYIRLRVSNGTAWSPWLTRVFKRNALPPGPDPARPDPGTPFEASAVALGVAKVIDPDGDAVLYEFEVSTDTGFSQIVFAQDSVAPAATEAAILADLGNPDDGYYWWRARAFDGYEHGPWGPSSNFQIDLMNDDPLPFELYTPIGDIGVYDLAPDMSWATAEDPDPTDRVTSYSLTIGTDPTMIFSLTYPDLQFATFKVDSLYSGARFFWQVAALDARGGVRESEIASFVIPAPGDVQPDLQFNVLDVVALVGIVFRSDPPPPSILATDVNGDCVVNILDVVTLVNLVFKNVPLTGAACGQPPPIAGKALHVPQDYATIQEAVTRAQSGDTVIVAPGTYQESVTIPYKEIILLGDTLAPTVNLHPITSGTALLNLIGIASPNGRVLGFVMEGATGAPAIAMSGSSATIRKCEIRNNTGGGITVSDGGHARIADNWIHGNTSHDGAGIYLKEATADILRNVIENNRADALGGGVYSDNRNSIVAKRTGMSYTNAVVQGNIFRGNFAAYWGGGLFMYDGFPITILENLFVADTSNHGGAIGNSGRDYAAIVDNTFDQCLSSIGNGGGNAVWWGGNADVGGVIRNNIISNTSADEGGAIGGVSGFDGLVDIDYNCLWNNTPSDYYRFTPGPNDLFVDPAYCDPGNGDYGLPPGSPCAGTGDGGTDRGAFDVGCGSP